MTDISRRGFLLGSASGLAVGTAGAIGVAPASADGLSNAGCRSPQLPAAEAVRPPDPRYDYLNSRGLNRRFVGKPVGDP